MARKTFVTSVLLVITCLAGQLHAQISSFQEAAALSDSATSNVIGEAVVNKRFDDNSWSKATKGLQYGEKPPPPEKKDAPTPDIDLPSKKSFMGIAQVLLIVIIAGALVLLLYFIFRNSGRNKPVVNPDDEWIAQLIEGDDPPEAILNKKLQEAIDAGNFPLAIRILYLEVLSALHRNNLIRWKKDKTNAMYGMELGKTQFFYEFAVLTRIFETSWYSKISTDINTFQAALPVFRRFVEQVNQSVNQLKEKPLP